MNRKKDSNYKYCVVPGCKSTTVTAPDKVFITLPKNRKSRILWQQAVRRSCHLGDQTIGFCCEEHFNLEEDMENYMYFKLMRNVPIKLKPGTVPHIFDCQKDGKMMPSRNARILRKATHMTKKRHDTWMRALGRDPTVERLSEKNVVCSKHFSEENIQREGKRISLRPNAVPTLYLRNRSSQPSTSSTKCLSELEPQDYISEVEVKIEPEHVTVKNEPLHEDAEVNYNTITPSLESLPESAVEVGGIATTFATSPSSGIAFCRLCLKPTNNGGMVSLTTLDVNYHNKSEEFYINDADGAEKFSKMIKTLMPTFNFGLIYNPKMCRLCRSRLELAFKFVEEAMDSQKTIEAFKAQYGRNEEIVLSEDIINYQSKLSDTPPPEKKRKLSLPTTNSSSHHQEYCEVQSSQTESALSNVGRGEGLGDYLATTEELIDIVKEESFCLLEDEVKIEIDSFDIERESFTQMETAGCAGGDYRTIKSEPEEADNHRDSYYLSPCFNLTNNQNADVSDNIFDTTSTINVKKKCISSPPVAIIRDVEKS